MLNKCVAAVFFQKIPKEKCTQIPKENCKDIPIQVPKQVWPVNCPNST